MPQTQTLSTVPPPTKHQLAVMIWLAVFPTLSVLNLALSGVTGGLPIVVKTFVLATVAVPIVMYAVMPRLQRLRAWLLGRRDVTASRSARGSDARARRGPAG